MTLYRQLLLFTLALLFFLFAGTWTARLHTTRAFLQDQLAAHAQDTATSLGLSISSHMATMDIPAMEAMIDAIFDRGYYQQIRLTGINGRILVDRTIAVRSPGVPAWFIRWLPLEGPSASAMIMNGWQRSGIVRVTSHPGYAYRTLWETLVRTTLWFSLTMLLVALAGGLALRLLLRPLARVERQALAVCQRQYRLQERIPRTRELRRVVLAMNRMTARIRETFEDQARVAEMLRGKVYQDPLTGLGNRRYLRGQVTSALAATDGVVKGALLLVHINDLGELNRRRGFQSGDELIRQVAAMLRSTCQGMPRSSLARLTGGDFAIFLPDSGPEEAGETAREIATGFGRLAAIQLGLSDDIGQVGGVLYDRPSDFTRLLAAADTALSRARTGGANRAVILPLSETGDRESRGRRQWKDLLEQTLARRSVRLYLQPAIRCDDHRKVVHQEVLARITGDSGRIMDAGLFIPLAQRLGLSSALDRLIMEKVLALTPANNPLAVNLSPLSLRDREFCAWLLAALEQRPAGTAALSFEFAEFGAVAHLELIREFGREVRRLGHGLGIDHFGQGLTNFGYLKSLHPDYVKIDSAFTSDLAERESDAFFFVCSLCSVAHSLDIEVMAEGVENEKQWRMVRELHMDAGKGFFIARPQPAEEHA
ncbi:EAL domain-containing protein [Thermodesulfobacteriota bacterium B35]